MKRIEMPVLLAVLLVAAAGCSSGQGPADRDGDGIPNEQDAFPDDPARFASYSTVVLDRLAGAQFSAAVAINGRSDVVGFSDDGQGGMRAVKWTLTGAGASAPAQLEAVAGDGYGVAYAIAADGVAVGECASGADVVAVAWPAGSATPTELSLAGFGPPAAAYAISGSRIVGEAAAAGNGVAVLWSGTGANPVDLGTLGGASSAAYAISGGLVVGESVDANGATRGAVWKLGNSGAPEAPVALPPLAGHVSSVALGVNAAGEIAGESESPAGEVHGVVWRVDAAGAPGAPVDLGIASASAVNASSRVAGHRSTPDQAAAWDMRNVSVAGDVVVPATFTNSQAYGLNDSNLVVGVADDRGFVAVPR